jgi:hypothetical protein
MGRRVNTDEVGFGGGVVTRTARFSFVVRPRQLER